MRGKMMTRDEIQTELGLSREMIFTLLGVPDADTIRRRKTSKGGYRYTRGLYLRERVLAVSQTPAAIRAQKRWEETVRGQYPAPGWTMRLGDIGRELAIDSFAVGRILNLMGYRSGGQLTDRAISEGCGARRWDGDRFHIDWHRDRVVAAIRSAASSPGSPAVTAAVEMAGFEQRAAQQLAAERERQQTLDDEQKDEQQVVLADLQAEVAAMLASEPSLTVMDAAEFVSADPSQRIALYRSLGAHEGARPNDLTLLKRRAAAEGFPA